MLTEPVHITRTASHWKQTKQHTKLSVYLINHSITDNFTQYLCVFFSSLLTGQLTNDCHNLHA